MVQMPPNVPLEVPTQAINSDCDGDRMTSDSDPDYGGDLGDHGAQAANKKGLKSPIESVMSFVKNYV